MSGGWQRAGSRQRGAGKGGRSGEGFVNTKLLVLAKELRAALMPQPRGAPGQRKPEWQCSACGTPNFMDRMCCRRCASLRAGPVAAKSPSHLGHRAEGLRAANRQRLPAGSVWVDGPPGQAQRQAPRATALEQAVGAARAAAASDGAVAALAAEAAAVKQEAADNRPLGARLDSARARVARMEAKEKAAEEALAAALAKRDAARAELAQAQDAVTRLDASPSGLRDREPPSPHS